MSILAGKVALVTGAGTGIGLETARLLAEAGATVAAVGRRHAVVEDVCKQIRTQGGNATAFAADISKPDEISRLISDITTSLGPIDILVNNAGSASTIPNVRWTSEEEWQTVMNVNMTAVYRLTQAVLPTMIGGNGGTIITVSSLAAIRPNLLGGAAYGAAKAAVRNFMAYLHTTFRNNQIRATCIMPGETATPIMDSRVRPPTEAERAMMMHPEDVARAVLLCCTLPDRTVIEELSIAPTRQRDISADLEAARWNGAPKEVLRQERP
ncbi:SDR family NAD(P)-dependent oxidoreductase [Gluconobacter cerinus]|uniref:SDR family oxidoreductase n=1 Tax=Gluconobacter cerinus TaxID=38307 RepID=UPI001B8CC3BF|nr:SDR family NAD(P)-dependent oxidoreductase [Gluconobacter cerinus]MBS1032140.1 SDR family NAD(P)-dependent oxidoreductase [Gluconobacter cerinus]